jgi:hypothetical protein
MGGDWLFMLTKQDPTPPENAELFVMKTGSASGTPPYSHYLTPYNFFLFGHIKIVGKESLSRHVKNYLQQFMKSSGPSCDRSWKTCFGTR